MKKLFTLAAAMIAAVGIASAQEACYVIGQVNDQSWDPSTGVEMTKVSDGVFETTVTANGYFGFAWQLSESGEWDGDDGINSFRLYPADGVQMITLVDNKAVIELSTEKAGGDSWTLGPDPVEVKFTVDYNDMTLTVEPQEEVVVDSRVFVVGDLSGWEFLDEYVMTETATSVYEIDNLVVTGGFKLANKGWAPINVGAGFEEVEDLPEGESAPATWPNLNESYIAFNDGGSANLVINNDPETAFTVSIKLDLTGEDPIVTITGNADGVEDVAVDANAPAEYFNLQGVRVANPENGLFIVRRGNNATKVLVK